MNHRNSRARIAPLNTHDANAYLKETKSYTLLKDIMKEPSADIVALEESILRVSHVRILVYNEGNGCQALDVKINFNS